MGNQVPTVVGRRRGPTRRRRVLAVLLLTCATTACGSAKIGRVDAFAQAGIAYADSVPDLLDESFELTVKRSSKTLVEMRATIDMAAMTRELLETLGHVDRNCHPDDPAPTTAQRRWLCVLEKQDRLLTERLEILDDFRSHTALLRTYFQTIRSLTDADAGSGIGPAAKGLVDKMGSVTSGLSDKSFNGKSIGDMLKDAAPVAVSAFRSAALTRELKANAQAIDRELTLQQEMMEALADIMMADLRLEAAAEHAERVDIPFTQGGTLPADWSDRRLAGYRKQVGSGDMAAAVQAARTLRLSFHELVEGRLDQAGVLLLMQDMDRLVSLAESLAGDG